VKRRIDCPDQPFGGETPKLPLHHVDPGEIDRDVVVAAAFAWHQLKTAASEGCGPTGTAEVDEGSEILRLLQTRCRTWPACKYLRDIPVQRHRRKRDGMARHDAGIEPVEPAGVPIVPGALLSDGVVADAIVPCVGKGRIRQLVHADGA
jgi:hypothetical protein